MQSLLDALGAVVVGGIVIVTVMTALTNVQTYGYNINMQLTLNKISESITSVLEERYLSSLAAFDPSSPPVSKDNAILIATSRRLQFWGELNGASSIIDVRVGAQDSTSGWWPFFVEVSGSTEFGEFDLGQQDIFTYFNENGNQIPFSGISIPAGLTDEIRSVRVELSYVLSGLADNSGTNTNLHNRIIIWKFFKNLYID